MANAAEPGLPASGPDDAPASLLDRIAARLPAIDGWLFPIVVFACALYAATAFYGSMLAQTHGRWSAPLDDVFIHFDYARATARGYPFQWTDGNGFSSGNTSVTYPFVLALGYWAFARGMDILVWAAIVALVSTTVFLWCSGELFAPLGRFAKYLAPAAVLSLGALDWTLWSGMENAFHLAVWGVTLTAALALSRAEAPASVVRRGWLLGALSVLLVLTRPESAVSVAAFGVFAAIAVGRRAGARSGVTTALRAGVPACAALAAQAAANRVLTGEWSPNGAIVKLALNNPYMSASDKLADYLFLLKYVVLRNTQHHFADAIPWGWLVPAVALVPLFARRTRPVAVLLWVQVVGWLALVALNGQVRWQNERYTMPAVAWTMLLFAMGLAVVASAGGRWVTRRGAPATALRVAAAAALALVYGAHEAPNMRDQIWFYGRASRNIRDQQVTAGEHLRRLGARRVLVGDAGALLYASDAEGLDLIGLGGYKDLPFARAGVHGLGASLELVERMPPSDRPDFMALYPSWWGDLPAFFGHRVDGVPIVGNVICGDSEKVIYRADWSALDATGAPRSLAKGERVVDELDVADLVSERAHHYVFPHPGMGFVDFRVLPDPGRPARDLFDAGRVIPAGHAERAVLRAPGGRGRLVLRTIAAHRVEIDVRIDGREAGTYVVGRTHTWTEPSVPLPEQLGRTFEVELTPRAGDLFDAHLWVVEAGNESTSHVAREPAR
ncbi:MAG TPA: hypothetical protein VHB21_06940 [Minicystis sp.]|nr:hypothetical protein [Minicystis sp.]